MNPIVNFSFELARSHHSPRLEAGLFYDLCQTLKMFCSRLKRNRKKSWDLMVYQQHPYLIGISFDQASLRMIVVTLVLQMMHSNHRGRKGGCALSEKFEQVQNR